MSPGWSATTNDGVVSQAAGPGVATGIGLTIRFDLSAGDSEGVTSRFEIVPEPMGLLLVGLGVLGIAGRRLRAD